MYVKGEFGGEVDYACPTCGRVIALELFGGEVERELVSEGEFA
jgi:tRNA(Ile2) C34 agmatinyltransferase TiaS